VARSERLLELIQVLRATGGRPRPDARRGTRRVATHHLSRHPDPGPGRRLHEVCHRKGGPLRRLRAGDGIVYYSPTVSLAAKDRLQALTGIGLLKDDRIYQIDMGGGFHPFRRDVNYVDANEASIVALLDTLELTRGKQNWVYPFRRDWSRSRRAISP
jgi:hypothetical protein